MRKFEKAIDNELSQRLTANAREIQTILADYRTGLGQKREKYARDESLLYHLFTGDYEGLKGLSLNYLQSDFATSLSFFNHQGRMLFTVFKDQRGRLQDFQPISERVLLSDKYMINLKENNELGLVELRENQKISLILISKLTNSSGKLLGYLEQILDLDRIFVERIRAKLKLEVVFFRENGSPVLASHPEFYQNKDETLKEALRKAKDNFFETNLNGEPFGFLIQTVDWETSKFYMAVGVSKKDSKDVIAKINYAFLGVVGAVVIFLIITIIISSSWVVRPLNELVEALQSFESQEQAITIPVKNDTEIGLLTKSFNEMSLKITQARTDLKKKITELEKTNAELKETQTRLIHSAKMISLGQLVAGVAHELNNPIGFIYSNMGHLRDYSVKLLELIDVAEKTPEKLTSLKNDYELDYIKTDLPKLIQSCEDGARRTRDIVLGLRNFSRLDRASLKEIDLRECLDNTLELLKGEIKNRIEITKQYQAVAPVLCFVTQINQVLMNILSNAAQAIKTEGKIWIATEAVHADTKRPDSEEKFKEEGVLISIQDNGSGIQEKILEQIFDPFFTTKDVGQGTGLGLSISYGIIHDHGGDIYVKSEENVGTEFTIYLPLKPPHLAS